MRLGEIGDNFAAVPTQSIAEGDTVIATGNYSWNHETSAKPSEVKMVHVWKVADGKLTEFQQHTDRARVRDLTA